ncbi:UNVERIFIED_CONTAM: hypothetical protein PYX00_000106 [Menopon gallinae]|uniref:RING-CH-type domain-containing protein n=1 Tax=Menopon gallinae TaxID=328185 RepID=A0AAW2I7N6_9NEOP
MTGSTSVAVKSNDESWNITNTNTPLCRICQGPSAATNYLVSPCNCKGTLAFVHFSCLEKWLNTSSRISCELCSFQYDTLQTRRYSLLESLRLWIRHPVNWRHLQVDFFIFTLLSIVTLGFVLICVFGLEYFIIEGKKYGVSQMWTKGVLNFFMTVIIVGYTGSMVFLLKEQLRPWYYWWTNTYNIKLRLSGQKAFANADRKEFDEIMLKPYRVNENSRQDIPDVHAAGVRGGNSSESNV